MSINNKPLTGLRVEEPNNDCIPETFDVERVHYAIDGAIDAIGFTAFFGKLDHIPFIATGELMSISADKLEQTAKEDSND